MSKKNLDLSGKLQIVLRPAKNTISAMHKKLGKATKPVLFVSAFIVVGVLALVIVKAAPFTRNIQPESASISGNAVSMSGSGVSGSGYLHFGAHGSNGGECANGPNFTSPNICLNPASVISPRVGETQNRLRQTFTSGYPVSTGDVSSFRLNCEYSHVNKDDPIVYPGQENAAHWHMYYGNTAANYSFTNARTQGNSTCEGGAVNKTAYWAPALVDTNSYNPTTKQFNIAEPMKFIGDYETGGAPMQVYYKSGYWGINPRNVQPFPQGLRMIAGANASVEPTGPHGQVAGGNMYVWFDCIRNGDTLSVVNGIHKRTSIPTDCPPGRYIQANIHFPQCGAVHSNGRPVLDTSEDPVRYPNNDHRSHMAYGNGWSSSGYSGCPSTHPIAYAEVLEHFRWKVPPGGASGLRFSSDMYPGRPAGWTFHADWWNGWDDNILNNILNHCYYQTPRDCGTGWDATLYPHPNGGYYGFDSARNSTW